MLSPAARRDAARLAARYRASGPSRHVAIDGFLSPALARSVVGELPGADAKCFTERGSDGVSIARAPQSLGPAMARLDAESRSPEFLGWLSRVSGVPGLRRNASADCGGLFNYADDSDMDVHLDSNDVDIHCAQTGHPRKVNMLLYLTPGWRDEWGGHFELYRDPGRPARKRYAPLFNRCVLFDSHETSWHAVAPITRAGVRKGLDRLVLIMNFYSTDAAGAKKAPPHYNILLPRPLPARLRAGRVPRLAELVEASRLLARRDARIAGLRALERLSRTGRAPKAEARAAADPFDVMPGLPRGIAPGVALTRRSFAELRALFDRRDRTLRRLYRGQYGWIRRLRARSPGLVPPGY